MADSEAEKEEAVGKALKKLYPYLVKNLPVDVRHELYARNMLTWHEKESIATKADKESSHKANEAILSALEKRGPTALDSLIESLEEEDANRNVIERIKKEFKLASTRVRPIALSKPKEEQEPSVLPTEQKSSDTSTEGTDRPIKSVYKMSSKPRGIGLIINNKLFTNGMKDRVGTDRDAESLTELSIYLGFKTKRYDSVKWDTMKAILEDISSQDHSKYDCLFIALLSHGINGKLYSSDGVLVPVEKITGYFNGTTCPSLIGKPKIFIIQACRGQKFDYGVLASADGTDGVGEGGEDGLEVVRLEEDKFLEEDEETVLDGDETDGGGYDEKSLPSEADFLLAYATIPGFVSWRNSEFGAWFVKAFVDTMFEFAKKEHLLDILTEVNRRVAEDFKSRGKNKQIPAPVSMLTRKLYFRPGSYD